jgi:hypothetical protein
LTVAVGTGRRFGISPLVEAGTVLIIRINGIVVFIEAAASPEVSATLIGIPRNF